MEQASRIIARSGGLSKVLDNEQIACRAWARVVGKRLAKYSRAAKLVRERLVVEVDDNMWKQSLYGLRYQILRKLSAALGEDMVTDIEFRVMPARFAAQRSTGATLFEPAPAANNANADEAEAIEDPGLRRIYRQARRRETA